MMPYPSRIDVPVCQPKRKGILIAMSPEQLASHVLKVDAKERGKMSSRLLVLDCRSFVSFAKGHVSGSVNVHCPTILRRRDRLPLRTLVRGNETATALTNGRRGPVVLYDEKGIIPKPNFQTEEHPSSILTLVAKRLRLETRLETIYFLEGGYQSFSRVCPHLCVSENALHLGELAKSVSPPTWPSPKSLSLAPVSSTVSSLPTYGTVDDGPAEILPHLWLGDARDAASHQNLRSFGYTALLTVANKFGQEEDKKCEELDKGENLECEGEQLRHMRVPVNDSPAEAIENFFDQTLEFIERERREGGKVLVHCRAGISRSATICIAYVMAHRAVSMEEAFAHVCERRRFVAPNFGFLRQLLAYERRLQSIVHQP